MTIATVLENAGVLTTLEPAFGESFVSGLAYDSRLVELANLFFAFPEHAPMAAVLRQMP